MHQNVLGIQACEAIKRRMQITYKLNALGEQHFSSASVVFSR